MDPCSHQVLLVPILPTTYGDRMGRYAWITWLICAVVSTAQAEQRRIYYSTGTGFFVSNAGYVVTNAHVVQDCMKDRITLKGAVNAKAELVATDEIHDLALLLSTVPPRNIAKLAATQRSIEKGDPVMVMGYPHHLREAGRYSIAHAHIIDVRGPQGEPKWLQFSDSAQAGNSGGPLLDESGNAIGVVTGKSELFRVDQRTNKHTLLNSADLAVALPALKTFLVQNHVSFQLGDTRIRRTQRALEASAREFITNVQCITDIEPLR